MKTSFSVVLCFSLYFASGQNYKEGDECMVGSWPATCTPFKECQSAKNDMENGNEIQYCSGNGTDGLVCCKIYYGIISGIRTNTKEFPHMALLGYEVDVYNTVWDCGGSLISDRWIITAAHCTWKEGAGEVSKVRLGDSELQSDPNPNDIYNVERIVNHPRYRGNRVYDDIALVKLDRSVTFTIFNGPACLHSGTSINRDKVIATGYGLTQAGNINSRSESLMKVDLEPFTFDECSSALPQSRKYPEGLRNATQVCFGSRNDDRDTCQGDSGSPVQITNDAPTTCTLGYNIVAITSFGKSCGIKGQPAVYTRISPYVNWIKSVVPEANLQN